MGSSFKNLNVELTASASKFVATMRQSQVAVSGLNAEIRKTSTEARAVGTALSSSSSTATRFAQALSSAGQRASSELEKAHQKVLNLSADQHRSITTMSRDVGLLGLGITGGLALAVRAAANFEQAMSGVKAAIGSQGTAAAIDQLRKAALDAGQATVFTATEAAQAEQELAKAGVSVRDILSGGLTGVLSLAAAGQLSVAESAKVAASTMNTFGLAGRDVGHVADLLAKGANAAQGEVSDFALALNQSALVARQFGLNVDETVTALTLFARTGLMGSDAGTSLRQMFIQLSNPSQKAQQAMKELGLTVYDTQGQFVGFRNLAEQLQKTLGNASDQTRNYALATIFGADAIRVANILVKEGSIGIDRMTNSLEGQADAAEVARIRMDNLKGDLEKLKGSLDTALIKSGEQGTSVLRELVQTATSSVNTFSQLPGPVQAAGFAFAALASATALTVAGGGTLVVKYSELSQALQNMGTVGQRTATGLALVTKGLGAASVIAAVAGPVYALYARDKAEAAAVTERLSRALADEAAGQKGATDRAIINELVNNKQRDTIKALGVDQRSVNDAILGSADAQRRVFDALVATEPAIGRSAFAQKELQQALSGNADAARKFIENQKAIGGDQATVRQVGYLALNIANLSEKTGDAREKNQALAQATEEVVQASGLQGQAADQLRAQLSGLSSTTDGLTEAQKNLQKAISEFTDPVSVYKDALQKKEEAERTAFENAKQVARERSASSRAAAQDEVASARDALQSRQAAEREDLARRRANLQSGQASQREALQQEGVSLQEKQRKERESFDTTHKVTKEGSDDFGTFAANVKLSLSEYAAELEKRNKDLLNWRTNLIKVASKVGPDVAEELAKLGVDAAPIVAEFADGTEAEVKRAADAMRTNMALAADGISTDLDLAFKIAAQVGSKGAGATADAIATALGARVDDVQRVAGEYSLAIAGAANPILEALGERAIIVPKDSFPGSSGSRSLGSYAEGGIENHSAQIASPGPIRVWAEPETGGEAYIPLASSKETRSEEIWRRVGAMKGWQFGPFTPGVQHFAAGGFSNPKIKPPKDLGIGAINDIADAAMAREYVAYTAFSGGPLPLGTGDAGSGFGWAINYLKGTGVPYGVSSTTGGQHSKSSLHYSGKAADFVGPDLMAIFSQFMKVGANLAELIYSPAGVGIKNGQPVDIRSFYGDDVYRQHFDHVHVGTYDSGGMLQPGWTAAYNGTGKPEAVVNETAMARIISRAIADSLGGSKPGIGQVIINDANATEAVRELRRQLG